MKIEILGSHCRTSGTQEVTRAKVRQLITVLALQDEPVRATTLTALLWDRPVTPGSLNQALHLARRARPPGRLVTDAGGYRLALTPADDFDLARFRSFMDKARAVRGVDATTAVTLYREALALWGDPPLGDLPDTSMTIPIRARLLAELRSTREELAEMLLVIGEPHELLAPASGWLAEDPYNERLRGLLMLALHRTDRKGEALQLYRSGANLLDDAPPGPWLRRLAQQIHHNQPSLEWRSPWASRPSLDAVAAAAELDTSVVSPARTYDYLLGGNNHFPVDREAIDRLMLTIPHLRHVAQGNRRFLVEAVRYVAWRGVHQFLDIGSGLPTVDNVHQVAQRITPDAHTVYVDNDATVRAHATALLHGQEDTTIFINGDLRDPAQILRTTETQRLLDFDQPIAVILCAIVHFLDLHDAQRVIAELIEPLPPGSYLAVSGVTSTGSTPEAMQALTHTSRDSTVTVHLRTRTQ
ncbi:SAM-dependent methyltransferase [Actinomadura rubrisoli]|nr:SAM-dependent methyltransferase [Actinomadura rubrisoli]